MQSAEQSWSEDTWFHLAALPGLKHEALDNNSLFDSKSDNRTWSYLRISPILKIKSFLIIYDQMLIKLGSTMFCAHWTLQLMNTLFCWSQLVLTCMRGMTVHVWCLYKKITSSHGNSHGKKLHVSLTDSFIEGVGMAVQAHNWTIGLRIKFSMSKKTINLIWGKLPFL